MLALVQAGGFFSMHLGGLESPKVPLELPGDFLQQQGAGVVF